MLAAQNARGQGPCSPAPASPDRGEGCSIYGLSVGCDTRLLPSRLQHPNKGAVDPQGQIYHLRGWGCRGGVTADRNTRFWKLLLMGGSGADPET